ncbi:MAG TPA: glycosyltransferase family 2 protein [bacterium]|nr:glycosyltransferase family 2 protein [bacterium]
MSVPDVSILIVHTFEQRLIRQTLRGIRRAAPQLHVEILIIDNNPAAGIADMLKREFPEVRYFAKQNEGFGSAMNIGMKAAKGKYILVFNPDIIISAGALEKLYTYMEQHPDVGIVGPKLLNADGTLQYSCNRYHEVLVPILRRTPLGRLSFGKRKVDHFLMKDSSHDEIVEVDWLMGSSLFTRAEALGKVGYFDERFFMYFEDTDLCWRFWEAGYKVIYNPEAVMVHYHRRASADGSLFKQLRSPLTWHHIRSAYKFFRKHSGQKNPRELAQLSSS